MAAGATRQYTAIFAIGGKVLANFKGAMKTAEQRMQGLRKAAAGVGVAIGGLLGLAGTFSLAKIFKGSTEAAEQEEERLRSIQVLLLKNNQIRAAGGGDTKKALEFAGKQRDLIIAHNEELAKQGVLSRTVYDEMAKQLAIAGVPTKQIMHSVGAMGDLLVAIKGVNANQEQGAELGLAMSKAIMTGIGKALQAYGIFLDKDWGKQFVTYQARLDDLMQRMGFAEGESARRANEPLGRLAVMRKELEKLGKEIGYEIIPVLGKMADAWLQAMPEIKPYIISGVHSLASAFSKLSDNALDFVKQAKKEDIGFTLSALWQGLIDLKNALFGVDEANKKVKESFGTWLAKWLNEELKAYAELIERIVSAVKTLQGLTKTSQATSQAREANRPVLQGNIWSGKWVSPKAAPTPAPTPTPAAAAAIAPQASAATGALQGMQVSSKLQPYLGAFEEAGKQYGIDPRLLLAIAQQENVAAADLNPLGISPGGGGPTHFADMEAAKAGIMKQAALMSRGIYQGTGPYAGAKTLAELAQVYSPIGASNDPYGTNVTELSGWRSKLRAMGVDPDMRLGGSSSTANHYNFQPAVTINGPADDAARHAMDTQLRDLSKNFIAEFKRAQRQERRLSYEGG